MYGIPDVTPCHFPKTTQPGYLRNGLFECLERMLNGQLKLA